MDKDVKFWVSELALASKHEKRWRERARRVLDIYRSDAGGDDIRFNILWSNTQTQKPALYSATPKPVIKRRHRQEDPVARACAMMLERTSEYLLDPGGDYDFDRVAEKCIMDYLLPGRMVARVKYHPILSPSVREQVSDEVPKDTEFKINEEGKFVFDEKFDELVDEEVRVYHVPYDTYRQSVADHWEDVWWVAFGNNFLTREEIIDQFGEEHADVPMAHLAHMEEEDGRVKEGETREIRKAQVWEIWDREDRKVYAIVEGYDKFLMEIDDPLKLRGFFPCPEPVLIVETPNTLIPVPEYTLYQCQAEELNLITRRIENLVKAMKLTGIYPGSEKNTISKLLESDENRLVPVEDWGAITERGGLNGMIEWIPLRDIADAWQRLMTYRVTLIQSIFELTGISDIQRGATDPRETKGAQQLKAGFATRRLLPKQQDTQRFFRDLFRLQAEVVAEHFQTDTIARMANMPITPEVEQAREYMKDDALRSFIIDIETDSTIAADEQMDKQGVAEFTAAMGQFMGQIFPIVQMQPAAIGPLGKMLLWMTRKFRIARDAEDELEEFLATFNQLPDNSNKEAEAQAQAAQAEMQMKMQEAQAKLQLEQKKAEADIQKQAAEMQMKMRESEQELAIERERFALEKQKLEMEIAEKQEKIRLMREEAEAKMVLTAVDQRAKREQKASEKKPEALPNITVPAQKGRRIKLIKGEKGTVEGAEITPMPDTKRVTFKRGADNRIESGELD